MVCCVALSLWYTEHTTSVIQKKKKRKGRYKAPHFIFVVLRRRLRLGGLWNKSLIDTFVQFLQEGVEGSLVRSSVFGRRSDCQ